MKILFLFLSFVLLCGICPTTAVKSVEYRPVVLLHGLLASAEAMSHAEKWIKADFPGIYIHNVEIGNGRMDSLEIDINKQVDIFAEHVQSDPKLSKGFNLICHSQGGLICRAFIERYNKPKVHNAISWAGPYDGVYGVPDVNAICPDDLCPWLNDLFDLVMDGGWIDQYVQSHVSFATYWKDPLNRKDYLKYNTFLADINNEKPEKNATYKANIESLNKLLMIYSTSDTIVIPQTSPWFQFYEWGSDSKVSNWQNTEQYTENWLGLKTLYEQGRLEHQSVPCPHQDIPRASCRPWYDKYTRPLLNNTMDD